MRIFFVFCKFGGLLFLLFYVFIREDEDDAQDKSECDVSDFGGTKSDYCSDNGQGDGEDDGQDRTGFNYKYSRCRRGAFTDGDLKILKQAKLEAYKI